MTENKAKVPDHPLERIALSCSGGGYRAAGFHLGSMAYLQKLRYNRRPLLENVSMLSTVSGGTITGIVYALGKQERKSFKEIYEKLLDDLGKLDLLKEGLEKLNPEVAMNNPCKRKNLINAFAELYDTHFTGGATFAGLATMQSHLEAVVFNSTEFNNGVNFRFRNKGTGYFGNYYLRVRELAALEVKLADAMAASSCFTGGFEPIVWPSDFLYEKAVELKKITVAPVGIMDGGIYDNQGIDSILTYKANGDGPYFDLIIVSDVASPYMTPYCPTVENEKKGIRSWTVEQVTKRITAVNRTINWALPVLMLVSFLLPALWKYPNTIGTGIGLAFGVVFAILWMAKRRLVKKVSGLQTYINGLWSSYVPPFIQGKLSVLKIKQLSLHRLEPLLLDRLNSLLTLLLDVFLKVVRRLNYYKVYDDDRYQYRRISNLIRELTEIDFNSRVARPPDPLKQDPTVQANTILKGTYNEMIGPAIKRVAEFASSFGTTLWFTDKDKLGGLLENLVAAGQVTMCYNMVEYLELLLFVKDNGFNELPQATQDEVKELYRQCKTDWSDFKNDPFFLVNKPDLLVS